MVELLQSIREALQIIATLPGLASLVGGVVSGIVIGAIPGISPAMGVALLVPYSYGWEPILAFIFFVSAYQASSYGGSVTAIIANVPGTPSSAVTAVEGYQLSKRGKSAFALFIALLASAIGGIIGCVFLILLTIPLAKIGLAFGPPEYLSIVLFALLSVILLERKGILKGLMGCLIGMVVAFIGIDPITGEERLTFGIMELYDGIQLVPFMVGIFALPEAFSALRRDAPAKMGSSILHWLTDLWLALKVVINRRLTLLRSSFLGAVVGVVPGAGATLASFLAYGVEKSLSTKKSEFGKGAPDGVIASESANSASVGGALVPLLSLGIPGSATDAVLLGALSLHGLVAGPELYIRHRDLVVSIFLAVILANFLILIVGGSGIWFWSRVANMSQRILSPFIVVAAFAGSYLVRGEVFDVAVCFMAGVLGYILKWIRIKPLIVVLGFILFPILEMNFRRMIMMGGIKMLVTDPIFISLALVLGIISGWYYATCPQRGKQ